MAGHPVSAPKPPPCGCPPPVDGQIRHQRGVCTDPVVARLGWYGDPPGYAYGRCMMGCGAVGGDLVGQWDVKPSPPGAPYTRHLPYGFVRLWPHVHAQGPRLGPCIGGNQLVAPLPLMGPSRVDRDAAAAAYNTAFEELTLF